MKKRNKYLLNIGVSTIGFVPIVSVISCGSKDFDTKLTTQKETHSKNENIFCDLVGNKVTNINIGYYTNSFPDGDSPRIPDSVTSIGSFAFQNAKIPLGLKIPNTVKNIETDAFQGIGYLFKTTDEIGTSLGDWKDKSSNLVNVNDLDLFSGVTSIEGHAFKNATLPVGFTIPKNVIVDNYAFQGAGYLFKTKDEKGVSLGEKKDTNSKLLNVSDPNLFIDVTEISEGAFAYLTLPYDFKILDSVITIGDAAFQNATLPVGFTIPKSATNIITNAFEGTGYLF